jgi:hypothetical protein
MRCIGCQRVLGVGDRFIEDSASGFIGQDSTSGVDDLLADLFGGRGGKVVVCEDCEDYSFETVWGDEES